MTYQTIYSSTATKRIMKSDLYIILREARMNNKKSGVSGFLLFSDGTFIQALEGEEEVVKSIMGKISNDSRHDSLNILQEKNINERSFQNWEMAYVSPSPRDMATWSGLHNTTTLQDVILMIQKSPDIMANILPNLLQNIIDTDQDLEEAS